MLDESVIHFVPKQQILQMDKHLTVLALALVYHREEKHKNLFLLILLHRTVSTKTRHS